MLAEQRADIILHELSALRTVSVSYLCQLTGASEATIRRDLNTLANLGKLSKVRGGATLAETEEVFGKMPESSRLHLAEKDGSPGTPPVSSPTTMSSIWMQAAR